MELYERVALPVMSYIERPLVVNCASNGMLGQCHLHSLYAQLHVDMVGVRLIRQISTRTDEWVKMCLQVLQWVFAAAPGHPALQEICDHIAANALTRFSNNTNRDTLERTGPGVWTDVVLKHATLHRLATVRHSEGLPQRLPVTLIKCIQGLSEG